ncbi:MAG TPA: thiolase family protein [Candidatus Dormibacteraeota bacterium]|nr:thiolase family protein [Candidatus Dormibacteraeota bacterium]
MSEALIASAFESAYTRHPDESQTTERLLADAFVGAVAAAGLSRDDVDGLAVSSFSLKPDHAIDLAWKLGLKPRWLMEDTNGGASGLNMLQHAVRAVEAGDAETVVVCAGDRLEREDFAVLVNNYNVATRDWLAPLEFGGPNSLFALVTQRHAEKHGLGREDYACVPLAQRAWASLNPGAVYRDELALEEYLAAGFVASPLCRYDCVPVVAGADAVVVTSRASSGVRVRALRALHNPDDQQGDGIDPSGFAAFAPDLWAAAGVGPEEVDAAYLYDDYPVMVLVQASDLGLVADGDLPRFCQQRLLRERWPLNTSGGQLSAGQAGAAGGMHGLVEAVTQLRGGAGERQVPNARLALVAGYGMVLYRHGACHNAAVLERVDS